MAIYAAIGAVGFVFLLVMLFLGDIGGDHDLGGHDIGGHDVYLATAGESNGGGNLQGVGFLVDTEGDDSYTARGHATNGGGAWGGHGLLFDGGGEDRYVADVGPFPLQGVNGGAGAGPAGKETEILSTGLLWDDGGRDTYWDNIANPAANGSGQDVTVVPKTSSTNDRGVPLWLPWWLTL